MPLLTTRTLRTVGSAVAVVATLPYLVLKLLWLGGSTVGVTSDAGLAEMHSSRFVVGNLVTVGLMAVAAGFAVALTRPWAHRVPAKIVFTLGAGATGLLAPILVGMPIGLVLQLALNGDIKPGDDSGLAGWVFGIVYIGFGLLGLAMAVLVVDHVRSRWGLLMSAPPASPPRAAAVAGAVGLLPFAAAMTFWGIAGVGEGGPQGMDLPAQRTVLVVSGLLAAAAFVAPFATSAAQRRPRTAWLLTWTGCCVTAIQGPAQLLLAHGGEIQPGVAAVAALSTPGACAYGLGVLRGRLGRSEIAAPIVAHCPATVCRSSCSP